MQIQSILRMVSSVSFKWYIWLTRKYEIEIVLEVVRYNQRWPICHFNRFFNAPQSTQIQHFTYISPNKDVQYSPRISILIDFFLYDFCRILKVEMPKSYKNLTKKFIHIEILGEYCIVMIFGVIFEVLGGETTWEFSESKNNKVNFKPLMWMCRNH